MGNPGCWARPRLLRVCEADWRHAGRARDCGAAERAARRRASLGQGAPQGLASRRSAERGGREQDDRGRQHRGRGGHAAGRAQPPHPEGVSRALGPAHRRHKLERAIGVCDRRRKRGARRHRAEGQAHLGPRLRRRRRAPPGCEPRGQAPLDRSRRAGVGDLHRRRLPAEPAASLAPLLAWVHGARPHLQSRRSQGLGDVGGSAIPCTRSTLEPAGGHLLCASVLLPNMSRSTRSLRSLATRSRRADTATESSRSMLERGVCSRLRRRRQAPSTSRPPGGSLSQRRSSTGPSPNSTRTCGGSCPHGWPEPRGPSR